VASAGADELAVAETQLQALLDPYRDQLEAYELYGAPYLRRPGAKAHDWFAGVSRGNGVIRLFLLPMHHDPALLEGISPAVLKRKTGASVFSFKTIDDDQVGELEALLARAFERYMTRDA
jgi:hypothetical protein